MTTSFPFIAFSAVVVLMYQLSRSPWWRKSVLLAANMALVLTLGTGFRSLVPFAVFLLVGYLGIRVVRAWPAGSLTPVILVTLASFVWMKKYAFVPTSWLLPFPYVTVGLSYILFRVLQVMIDAKNGSLPDNISPISYFNFTTSFMTLATGPIQRYQDHAKSIRESFEVRLSAATAFAGTERVVKGLFKVNVLALLFSTLQLRLIDTLTDPSNQRRILHGALILVTYAFFIYCNFSGYIDIVIGVGMFLGFALPENFARPLLSDSFMDFWANRWHITLSLWLRAYVYNPLILTLMRRFPARHLEPLWAVLVFFVTFFLIGVWHGQTSEFIAFGLLLGLGVSVNKAYQILTIGAIGRKQYSKLSANPLYQAVSRGLTFTYFCLTLMLFWSSWQQIRELRSAVSAGEIVALVALIFAASAVLLSVWERTGKWLSGNAWNTDPVLVQCARTAIIAAFAIIIVAVSFFLNQPAPDIVYRAF